MQGANASILYMVNLAVTSRPNFLDICKGLIYILLFNFNRELWMHLRKQLRVTMAVSPFMVECVWQQKVGKFIV